ncbi:hypothetical protein C8R44DRAFT_550064, partial [Mycena epipterygia]
FQILDIGRTNAGKTTMLKKVCRSIEDAEIFNLLGDKVFSTKIQQTSGLHGMEERLICKSNPQFIFHDSRGFESGSADE